MNGFIPKWMVVQKEFNVSEEEAKEMVMNATLSENLPKSETLEDLFEPEDIDPDLEP